MALTLGAMFFEGASPCCGYDGADEAEVVVSGQDRGSEALTDECGSSEEEETHTKAEALTDIVLERLVNRLNGRSGDLSGPLCSLIALLPEEAAVGELLKLSTLKQDPYKAELQIALQQAGAVVALLAAAVRGSEDVQRLAKLALSAIAINSGNAPMSAETVPPSPLGLTPNITPLNTPLATPAVTPLQGHLVAHNDCLDPLAMLMQGGGGFAQPMSRSRSSSSEPVRRLPGGSRTSSCEPIRRPSDSREPSERSLSSCQERRVVWGRLFGIHMRDAGANRVGSAAVDQAPKVAGKLANLSGRLDVVFVPPGHPQLEGIEKGHEQVGGQRRWQP